MYYIYDSQTCKIISVQDTAPTEGAYCVSSETFDLDLNNVIVGSVDANKNLTYRTIKAKPAEQLAAKIKDMRTENDTLGQQLSDLTLQNMTLNSTVDTLGETVAQQQLALISLQGGTT